MPDIQVYIYIYVRTFSVGVHGASPNFGKDFSESTIVVSKSRFNLTRKQHVCWPLEYSHIIFLQTNVGETVFKDKYADARRCGSLPF